MNARRPAAPASSIAAPLVVAALAGLAAIALHGALDRLQGALHEAKAQARTEELVFAAEELRAGAPIGARGLVVHSVREGAFPRAQVFAARELRSLVGRVPLEPILPGEAIRRERLDPASVRAGLEHLLEPGLRAVTVQLDHAAGMAGLLQLGVHVDVLCVVKPDEESGRREGWVAQTILQDVRVLAINRAVLGSGEQPRIETKRSFFNIARRVLLTLEVAPEDAESLALAARRGQLRVSLRRANDDDILVYGGPLRSDALWSLHPTLSALRRDRQEL